MSTAATKCNGCGRFKSPTYKELINCETCYLSFHKGCVSLPDGALVSKAWVCPKCKKKTRRGDNTSTPVRSVYGDCAKNLSSITVDGGNNMGHDVAVTDNGFRELRTELAVCVEELRGLRKEMVEFRASVAGIGERLDRFERRLAEVEQWKIDRDAKTVAGLECTIKQLKAELNYRDQEALHSDFEIGHHPEEKGEIIVHAVSVLATRLGINVKEHDIVFAERIGAAPGASETGAVDQRRTRRVVVRLTRRRLRDELLQAARVRRTLTANDAGRASPRIFINERLTRNNRQIFYRVREQCRKLQWSFSWTKRGRI